MVARHKPFIPAKAKALPHEGALALVCISAHHTECEQSAARLAESCCLDRHIPELVRCSETGSKWAVCDLCNL